MSFGRMLNVVDALAGGEPHKVIVGGIGPVPGDTICIEGAREAMRVSSKQRKEKPHISLPLASCGPGERMGWSGLKARDEVRVQEGKGVPYEAVVDILTDDLSVIWVIPVRVGSRRAFHHSDDVIISGRQ